MGSLISYLHSNRSAGLILISRMECYCYVEEDVRLRQKGHGA